MGRIAMDLLDEIRSYSTTQLVAMQNTFGCQHYQRFTECVFAKGEGVWLWDHEGKKYFDGNATYSTNAGGHRNEELIDALQVLLRDQCVPLTANAFVGTTQPLLVQKLTQLSGLDKALIMNSGAEAVETAIKIARRWGYRVKGIPTRRAKIISFKNCFHGRTITATTMLSETAYRDDFGPFPHGFTRDIPFNDIAALEEAITPETAAVLIEPIQCEGGMLIPSKKYFTDVRELCTKHRILLIVDEIQTGLGRTGKMFGHEWYCIKPDIMLLGKALGQIMPVSAVVGIAEAMNVLDHGSHGSTFGGNSIACGIALASLALITHNDAAWIKNSFNQGIYFKSALRAIQKRSPYVTEVRGRGLAIGIEIDTQKIRTDTLIRQLLENGVVSGNAHGIALRVTPALIVDKPAIDWALERFEKVLCP